MRAAANRHRLSTAARAVVVASAASFSLVLPAQASAQQWTAEARMGRLEFRLSPSDPPPATSFALGLGFAEPDRRFHFTAGVPLGEEDPVWGAVDLLERTSVEVGPVTLGIEGGTQGFLQRYTRSLETPSGPLTPPTVGEEVSYGWGFAARALPFVGVRSGPVSTEARAGASLYRSGLGDRTASRLVGIGELRAVAAPTPAFGVSAETRHYAAEDGSWTFAGLGAVATIEGTDLWGTVGHWFDDAVSLTPWSAGASTRLGPRFDLMVEARQDALDPVYGSSPRRSWTAALRVRLTDPPAAAAPVPASYDGATATIALSADDAGPEPRIAGDFNDWTPERMTRADGRWIWTGRLEPGVYEYAFVGPDGEWFVPPSVAGRTEDGMGGFVALLVVEEGAR